MYNINNYPREKTSSHGGSSFISIPNKGCMYSSLRMLHKVPFSHICFKCAETLHEGRDARPEDEGKVHAGHQGPTGLKGAYLCT